MRMRQGGVCVPGRVRSDSRWDLVAIRVARSPGVLVERTIGLTMNRMEGGRTRPRLNGLVGAGKCIEIRRAYAPGIWTSVVVC
jgi:hypothetical protein